MDPQPEKEIGGASSLRGYSGVRITAPPRAAPPGDLSGTSVIALLQPDVDDRQRARILAGAALAGVIFTVLAHEFGHWLAGLLVTGDVPDYLLVAVRQKVSTFTVAEGMTIWLAGPAFHLAALTFLAMLSMRTGGHGARTTVALGAAVLFSLVVALASWAIALATPPSEWSDDVPRAATFLRGPRMLWMNFMAAAYVATLGFPLVYWLRSIRRTSNTAMLLVPALVGAFEGLILLLAATWVVSLSL